MKHTQGPWEVACGAVYVAPAGDYDMNIRIAKMDRDEPRTSPTERDRNARLIATAPELLAACKEVLNAIDAFPHSRQKTPFGSPKGGIAKMLRATIAKAEAE